MPELTRDQLFASGLATPLPMQIRVDADNVLDVQAILRFLPGKRVVVRAKHDGRDVLAKWFLHTRHFELEIKQHQRLAESGVRTPALLWSQALADGGLCFYEFLPKLTSLAQRWAQASPPEQTALINDLLTVLEQLYTGGLYQSDLHLDNFGYAHRQLYALDAVSMQPLQNHEQRSNNLSLLLAQFAFVDWNKVSEAIIVRFPDLRREPLLLRAQRERKTRTQNFLAKIYRDCTYIRHWIIGSTAFLHTRIWCVREYATANLITALETIEKQEAQGEMLKRGNSSRVFSLMMDNRRIVVKNSRNKDIWRLLRRCLWQSRASKAWYFSHLLLDAGVNTPQPIALVERKLGPFTLESWFVCDYVEGDNLLDIGLHEALTDAQRSQLAYLFAALKQLCISHGDMKATNLLWSNEKLFVIDFDGMRQFRNSAEAQPAQEADKQRLLANWPKASWLARLRQQIDNAELFNP